MIIIARQSMQKINPTVFFLLVIYPILIITAGISYIYAFGISWLEIGLFLVGYYVANISVGLGLHRLWTHGAYKTNKYVEFFLALFAAGTLQGPALAWASDHYKHHTYTDEENDPHTPLKFKSRIIGFFWAHMGWMLYSPSFKQIDKVTLVKLGRNKILRWQLKYYWLIATFMNLVLPPLVGFVASGTIQGAVAGYLFIGIGRALQQQMTFCVNSLCHFVGSRKYDAGTARDIWWMFIFLLGENWHNYHHAFARDYRNGVKWYQLDVHKWLIYMMEKLGLAWDLVRTSEVRISSKIQETHQSIAQDFMIRLKAIEQAATGIARLAQEKLESTEKSAGIFAKDMNDKLNKLIASASRLAENTKQFLANPDMIQEKIILEATKHAKSLEKLANRLDLRIPTLRFN